MQEFVTKNIKFAAYLRMLGIHPQVKVLARGKALYNYKMAESEWQAHKTAFDKSDYLVFAQNLDAVLDLAY